MWPTTPSCLSAHLYIVKTPLEISLGTTFGKIIVSLMYLSFRITDLELLLHESDLAQNLICSLLPSLDIVTQLPSPDGERDGKDRVSPIFKGSRIQIGSFLVGLRFHFFKFRPLKFLFVNRGRDRATKDSTDASQNCATADVDKDDGITSEENTFSSSKMGDASPDKPDDLPTHVRLLFGSSRQF